MPSGPTIVSCVASDSMLYIIARDIPDELVATLTINSNTIKKFTLAYGGMGTRLNVRRFL